MVEQEVAKKGAGTKTSVKSYQRGIEAEKQKMKNYSKGFETNVKALQADIKSFQADIEKYSKDFREEAEKSMNEKVGKFNAEIRTQIKENKESVSRMANAVKFFINEVNKKKREFKSYAHGPFKDYIKEFWG